MTELDSLVVTIAALKEGADRIAGPGPDHLEILWRGKFIAYETILGCINKMRESAALSVSQAHEQPNFAQIMKDASEIRSSYGFILMRGAVAADEQDVYAVLKKEFEEHAEAFKRLETSIPRYGSAEWHALSGVSQAPPQADKEK